MYQNCDSFLPIVSLPLPTCLPLPWFRPLLSLALHVTVISDLFLMGPFSAVDKHSGMVVMVYRRGASSPV